MSKSIRQISAALDDVNEQLKENKEIIHKLNVKNVHLTEQIKEYQNVLQNILNEQNQKEIIYKKKINKKK